MLDNFHMIFFWSVKWLTHINPFVPNAPFLTLSPPWKHQKNFLWCFLMFSKGREKVHLEKMGWHNFHYYVFVCNKKNRELKFSQLINMRCFARFGTICAILKKEKHTWRSVTFSNTLPRVFFMFFKLYKWYQTAPHMIFTTAVHRSHFHVHLTNFFRRVFCTSPVDCFWQY